jgi:hypothetical protein
VANVTELIHPYPEMAARECRQTLWPVRSVEKSCRGCSRSACRRRQLLVYVFFASGDSTRNRRPVTTLTSSTETLTSNTCDDIPSGGSDYVSEHLTLRGDPSHA